jgi:multisubunit Na+/H+ antiporter MnhB subunit
MKKLLRFFTLVTLFVALFILCYSIVPSLTWIFGGSFKDVAQHPAYAIFAGLIVIIALGIVFNESFDDDFYSKEK